MKTGQRIRRVRYVAPTTLGMEVMTLDRLREMAPPGYLHAPQRPDFHLLILGRSGQGRHTVDFRDLPLGRACGIWVRPGQVQRFDHPSDVVADLVLFRPDFLIPQTRAAALADRPFGPMAFADPPELEALSAARSALGEEYGRMSAAGSEERSGRLEVLRHLLSVVVLRFAEAAAAEVRPRTGADELHDRFRDLLERDFMTEHAVEPYARSLGYSVRSLSRATQASAGTSPKQMIQARLALEAGRLLAHSNLTVTAIARTLGFADPSNFSSFFRQQTGASPRRFREEQRADSGSGAA